VLIGQVRIGPGQVQTQAQAQAMNAPKIPAALPPRGRFPDTWELRRTR
jgi:hypothetical protein